MATKPVRVFPYNTFTSRVGGGLNQVGYGSGSAISAPTPPTIGCKDTDMLNVFITNDGDVKKIYKRPGLTGIYNLQPTNGASGPPLGMTFWHGVPFAVVPDSLNGDTLIFPAGQPNSGTSGSAWTNTATGAYAPRTGAISFSLNNLIYLIGNLGPFTSQDVWVSPDGTTWYLMGTGPFPSTRSGYAGCMFNNNIYMFGGLQSGTYMNDVWVSADGNKWSQLPNAPWSGRQGMTALATSTGIFMFGGTTGSQVNDIWFTPDGKNWTQVAVTGAQWSARTFPMAWWFNNTLYVGGGLGGTYLNDVWASTTGGATWTQKTASAWSGTSGMAKSGTVVYNNRMWALGGYTTAGPFRTSNIYTSTDGVTWTVAGTMPQGAIGGVAAAVFQVPASVSPNQYKTIWLMGGDPASGVGTNLTYRGNLDTALVNQYTLTGGTGNRYDFASFNNGSQLLVKTNTGMWIVSDGSVNKVWDSNYPPFTARGIVVLGGFAHVMDLKGVIHTCALNDPSTWPALNVLGSSYDDDVGVGIAKVSNYLVAWGQYAMEVYYDAGNATGSPLSPYLAASVKIGCYSGDTIVSVDKSVIWVGQTHEGIRQVYMMNGLTPEVISTPDIDKLIAQANGPSIYSADFITYNNHTFYMLHMGSSVGLTLVYDLVSKQWTRWAWAPNSGLSGFNAATYGSASNLSNFGQNSFFMDQNCFASSLGGIYTDNGFLYYTVIQTQKFDGGNDYNKYWGPLVVVGDRQAGTPSIFFTDDDYQTWGPAHTVDLSLNRPVITRTGRSRRRAITYIQLDNNPMGLEYFEFPAVEQGGDAGG